MKLIMEKTSLRRLDADVMRSQLAYIASRVLGGNRGKVWSCSGTRIAEPNSNGNGLSYRATLQIVRVGRSAAPDVIRLQEQIMRKLATDVGRSKGWMIPGETVP